MHQSLGFLLTTVLWGRYCFPHFIAKCVMPKPFSFSPSQLAALALIHHLDPLAAKRLMRPFCSLSWTDPTSDVWTPWKSKLGPSLLFEMVPSSHAVSPRALSAALWCELEHGSCMFSTHPPRASFRKLQKPVVVC